MLTERGIFFLCKKSTQGSKAEAKIIATNKIANTSLIKNKNQRTKIKTTTLTRESVVILTLTLFGEFELGIKLFIFMNRNNYTNYIKIDYLCQSIIKLLTNFPSFAKVNSCA